MIAAGMDIRYEYSPESFMGTEMDDAVQICHAVHGPPSTPRRRHKVILNLPTTVENCMPNQFADELEYFIRNLPGRERAIISLHPHNDRGTGVATAEMGLLAGADRMEATLFGNGERTGNVDMVTVAMNMYTQGVDPELDFSDIEQDPGGVRAGAPRCRSASVSPMWASWCSPPSPAAIRMPSTRACSTWRSPDTDILGGSLSAHRPGGRGPRSMSPSSASTASPARAARPSSWQHNFGFDLPKAMHPEFGDIVQAETDRVGTRAASRRRIFELFKQEYHRDQRPLSSCISRTFQETHRRTAHSARHLLRHALLRGQATPSSSLRRGQRPHRRLLQRRPRAGHGPLHLCGLQGTRHQHRL